MARGVWSLVITALAACGSSSPAPDAAADAAHAATEAGADHRLQAEAGVDLTRRDSKGAPQPCGLKIGTSADVPAGTNDGLMIGGKARRFLVLKVNVPAGTTGKLPVVFVYHGYGSQAEHVDGGSWASSKNQPFLKVVPQAPSASIFPVWDFKANPDESSDVRFFDELLGCLRAELPVDDDRVHAIGSSMGGIFAAYLFTHRGDQLASFATVSGGFVSPFTFCSWPSAQLVAGLKTKAAGLIIWGGTSDQATWDFDAAAKTTTQTLRTNGHPVVQCDHGLGHEWPEDINPFLYRFFEDHPRGLTGDPYASGLPTGTPWGDWPTYCSVAP